MKKLLLSILVILFMTVNVKAGDVLYSTMTFPASDQVKVSAYYKTFTAGWDGMTWIFANFNNNNNGWQLIKGGNKTNASIANFYTKDPIDEKITKIVVHVDAFTTGLINSTYLEVASDTNFTDVQKIVVPIATGDLTYNVPTPAANMCYRISYDCQKGTSNGLVTISKVELYKYDASTVSTPTITPASGFLYDATDVAIDGSGADVYYSTDGTNYSKYTGTIAVNTSTTIYAYCQSGDKKSEVKSCAYTMAKSYASLDDLLNETPTSTGWPVVVPIKDEEIYGFYGSTTYRNGVYLVRTANSKNFELYCKDASMLWNAGDKLSGMAKGIYQNYNGQWEISLVSWDGFDIVKDETLPAITPSTGTYTEDQTVTIVDPSENNYTIYYTTDGTDPNESSNIYTAPFTVSNTTTVKAVLVDNDDKMSSVVTSVITISKTSSYSTVAELLAYCTATNATDAPSVKFEFTNLIVTGVNGSNVFVSDATGAFLFYGAGSQLTKGDIISGNVTGKLYSYNNLPELSVSDSWVNITNLSSGNTVTPITSVVANITKADANKYVRFEGIVFDSLSVSSNKTNYYFSDGTAIVMLRDNFVCLSGVNFTNEDCKYNINVFVIPFKETIQYYAVSATDVEANASLPIPESDWLSKSEIITYGNTSINTFKTNSDGTVSYTSSNQKVATISEDGTISLVGCGLTTITAATAKTSTFMGDKKSFELSVISGHTGKTADDAYCVGDVQVYYQEADTIKDVWVTAYIVGYANGAFNADKVVFGTTGALESNIVIAMDTTDISYANCIPVALEKTNDAITAVRDSINLSKHPEMLGKLVSLHGNIVKYFSTSGFKSVDSVVVYNDTYRVEDVNSDGKVDTQDVLAIYGYMQIASGEEQVPDGDVNSDGKVDTQDVLKVYEYIQNH